MFGKCALLLFYVPWNKCQLYELMYDRTIAAVFYCECLFHPVDLLFMVIQANLLLVE